jgi:O-antigen/teichoic acid export membrane protein
MTVTPPFKGASQRLNWLGSTAWVMAGNSAFLLFGFASNVIVVRTITIADYGRLSVALAIMAVLQEVLGGGLDVAMVRFTSQYWHSDPQRGNAVLCQSFWLKTIANGAIACLLWLFAPALAAHALGSADLTLPLRWAAVGLLGNSFVSFHLAVLQAQEIFGRYAAYRGFANGLKLGLLLVLAQTATLNLTTALMASTALALVIFVAGFAFAPPTYLWTKPTLSMFHAWRDLIGFGGWVMAANLLFNLYARFDVLFLQRLFPAKVAYYSVACGVVFLMDLATYSVMTALLPRSARLVSKEDYAEYLRSTFLKCALIALLLSPLFLLAGPLLRLMFSSRYDESVHIFQILFWGPLVSLLVYPLSLVLYARYKPSAVTLSNLVQFLVAVAGYAGLGPRFGQEGIATSAVAGRFAGGATLAVLVLRELREISNLAPDCNRLESEVAS